MGAIAVAQSSLLIPHRAKNKMFYAQYGAAEAFSATCTDLQDNIELFVDGKKIELPSLEGIAVINIPR